MWSCSCNFAKPFKTYLQTFSQRVPDREKIRCVTDNLVNEPILETICPELIQGQVVSTVDTEELVANDNLVTILVSVIVSFVFIVGGISAICCFRLVLLYNPYLICNVKFAKLNLNNPGK